MVRSLGSQKLFRLDTFPFGQNNPVLSGHFTRTNPCLRELFPIVHLATWLAFLFSQELP